ncbi:E3 ubiquitin-protein ligase MYLIP-A-like [Argopecten irradians]|uniref:E3 ubiquitin-protein ligase MYLIP-A-like n=1 Tax=Argopecten irradians TaxID=31199 RepID=UPI003724001C
MNEQKASDNEVRPEEVSSSTRDVEADIKDEMEPGDSNEDKETQMLQEENNRLKREQFCFVCQESLRVVAYYPCGHWSCCKVCDSAQLICPMCKGEIENRIFTYLS